MLLSRIFSFTNTGNINKISLAKDLLNNANIRAISHLSNATFSNIRTLNQTQNTPSSNNRPLVQKRLISGFFSNLLSSKETQGKIENAIQIRKKGEEVFVDECQIKSRSDGPIELYTTGLVYCTGILMIGKEKVGMAHIHDQGFEFMKNMFDATQPNQLIIYASSGVSEHSSGMGFYAEMMKNLNSLRTYAEQTGINCEIKNFEYPSPTIAHGPGLFYFNNQEKECFFIMTSGNMKKLNQTL